MRGRKSGSGTVGEKGVIKKGHAEGGGQKREANGGKKGNRGWKEGTKLDIGKGGKDLKTGDTRICVEREKDNVS